MACLLKKGGGLYPRLRVGAVLLAGGEGRRMGGVVKPLIRLQGVPLINRQLVALSGAGVDEAVVVTGYARAAIEEEMRSFTVTLAHNASYANGQDSSLRVGLAKLGEEFDAILVVLCDQPLLGAGDLTEMIGAFKKRPGGHLVVPTVDGQPGYPIILDATARTRILAGTTKSTIRELVEQEPESVHAHETANTRFVTALDTPEDLRALAQRTGWRLELPALKAVA